MTRPLTRFALAVLCLTASACDSGGASEADLLGTWNTQSGTRTTYLTVSQSQSLRDPSQPGTGGLVVSGAVSGTLRYFAGSTGADGPGAIVADGFVSFGGAATLALLAQDGDEVELVTLLPNGGGIVRTFAYAGFKTPYVFSPTSFRVASARFVEAGTGAEVTVAGTLTFPLIPLVAGRETVLENRTSTRAEAGRLSVTFAEGGVFTQTNQDLTTETGTWADVGGGQVRTRVGTREPVTYMYAVSGSALTLSTDEDVTALADEQFRLFFGLLPGTLTSARRESTEAFARGAAQAGGLAAPARAAGMPEPLLGRRGHALFSSPIR